MKNRRANTAGGIYFFTVDLSHRGSTSLVDRIEAPGSSPGQALRASVRKIRDWHPLIEADFSKAIPCGEWIDASRQSQGEGGIWQRRYWEHLIRDEIDLQGRVDYIHINPDKHGYAQRIGRPHRFIDPDRAELTSDWAYAPKALLMPVNAIDAFVGMRCTLRLRSGQALRQVQRMLIQTYVATAFGGEVGVQFIDSPCT